MSSVRPLTIAPEGWTSEAVEAFADAFYPSRPGTTTPIEENTLPSWLWRRRAADTQGGPETSVFQVIDRVAGSAAYAGWKKGLWNDELEARAFYDGVRSMLLDRCIALKPSSLTKLGVDWAYGTVARPSMAAQKSAGIEHRATAPDLETNFTIPTHGGKFTAAARNASIDSIVSDASTELRTRWNKFLMGSRDARPINLGFPDTADEWSGADKTAGAPRLVIDLLKFVHDNWTIDLAMLQKAVRLSVVLLDLHYDQLASGNPAHALAIGHVNLAPLLMVLGLPYDSSAGRATAAALTSIITAEAVLTSAELADAIAPCPAFMVQREATLRALRNHRRAAYGEHNDYEHISILPVSLDVDAGADLVLMAAARRLWDEAYDEAQKHGLRHLQLTSLFYEPVFAPLLECTAQGIEPEKQLVRQRSLGPEVYHRVLNPAVTKALTAAGCDPSDIKGITDYAIGNATLRGAPGVNHARLTEKGFDAAVLEKLEAYLPYVSHIHQAFTPWILGKTFCRQTLKIGDDKILDPRFDLLNHLGFTNEEIRQANAFCCGHNAVVGSAELPLAMHSVFASDSLSPDAIILMAAAAQSMVTGDVNLTLTLPAAASVEDRENLVLAAWMMGLKSITLAFEGFTAPIKRAMHKVATLAHHKPLHRKVAMPVPLPMAARTTPGMTSARAIIAKTKAKAPAHTVALRRGESQPIQVGLKKD